MKRLEIEYSKLSKENHDPPPAAKTARRIPSCKAAPIQGRLCSKFRRKLTDKRAKRLLILIKINLVFVHEASIM